ncbi:MAG: hypothetical protein FJ207_06900 [Gemmatimonadetes bacterium]|nr:hypothetical protein [Gemmatimonadota bacterium]
MKLRPRGLFVGVPLTLALAMSLGLACGSAEDGAAPPPGEHEPASTAPSTLAAPGPSDTTQGLRCIRGGTSREEVRAILGEPDSIAFGDWLYGRSSVTFGYGVVLDYANVDGNLRVCP